MGDRVHKGDVLVRLESTELQAQLQRPGAALAMAKANYENAKANLERIRSLYEQGRYPSSSWKRLKPQSLPVARIVRLLPCN